MTGIIGEVLSIFEETVPEGKSSGELVYSLSCGGFGIETCDVLAEEEKDFVLITKLSRDMQGESQRDLLEGEGWLDEDNTFQSPLLSGVIIDGDLRLRGTAPSDLKKKEIVSVIEDNNLDSLIISGALLSLDTTSKEILAAIEDKHTMLKKVFVDFTDSVSLTLLEELRDAVEKICKLVPKCYVSGDAVKVPEAIRISQENIPNYLD
ncbi:MAG: hypothetical protein KBS81_01545 [Spirochaetales bacterium]|nr:hypothetical protein [Candidatus Physcosoma equi]